MSVSPHPPTQHRNVRGFESATSKRETQILRGNGCRIPFLLTRLAVGQHKIRSVSTRSGGESQTRPKKQTTIASQTQDNKSPFTPNQSTKVHEIREANIMRYLTCKLKFHLASAKWRFFPP